VSRSLAFVGILSILGAVGTWTAVGQDSADQATTVVKTHMSDAERDRLMQEAMDQARKELETKKAKEASEATKAAEREKKKEEARLAAEAAAEKLANDKQTEAKAAADRKADEERMARELAEREKASTADSVKNELKPLPVKEDTVDLDEVKKETAEKKPEPENKSESGKKTVTSEKKLVVTEKAPEKKAEIDRNKSEDSDTKSEKSEKTVVEVLPTKEPGSNLTVKASASKDGEVKDVERDISFHKRDSGPSQSATGSDSVTVSGSVIGMMRSTGRAPRILVRDESGRMIQVVMEDSEKIPAAGARVTVRGRSVGEGAGGRVISSSSVNIESGATLRTPESVAEARGSAPVPGPGMMPPPPMPMLGPPVGMPPPMVIGGPMLPPPPPF